MADALIFCLLAQESVWVQPRARVGTLVPTRYYSLEVLRQFVVLWLLLLGWVLYGLAVLGLVNFLIFDVVEVSFEFLMSVIHLFLFKIFIILINLICNLGPVITLITHGIQSRKLRWLRH